MPFRDHELLFGDILKSVDAIESFLVDINSETYQADLKTRSAVERQLQIMTEAAIRLGDDAGRLCPGVDWRGIRGMGNVLRHEYEKVDDERIWEALHTLLTPLKIAVQLALTDIQAGKHPA